MLGTNAPRSWRRHLLLTTFAFVLVFRPVMIGAQQSWEGPNDGPIAKENKRVTFISHDFRNGGITSTYRGLFKASRVLGWELEVVDGHADLEIIRTSLNHAIAKQRDGIIIGGFDVELLRGEALSAMRSGVVMVGWHASEKPGPKNLLFYNVGSEPEEVARVAAEFVIKNSKNSVGVVIFSDDRFSVANAKARYMAQIIARCGKCRVLAIENIRIEQARAQIPEAVARINRKFGLAWTHNLAVNDVYFDAMNVALNINRRNDIRNVSAGDGSAIALSRIGSGMSQHEAVVAEPTGLQGWQLADELNRAFSNQPPSGYINKPILVTAPMLASLMGKDIDAHIPYRKGYCKIWGRREFMSD